MGQLHDIGKVSTKFKARLRGDSTSVDHSTAGAVVATKAYGSTIGRLLALCIAGHHSGLGDPDEIERRLASVLPDYAGWEAHTGPLAIAKTLTPTRRVPRSSCEWIPPSFSIAFAVRMLFSCLVDADFICTETFVNGAPLPRGSELGMASLRDCLAIHLQGLGASAEATELNTLRSRILNHAIGKAGDAPGFFTLTVPTGGGKTLASLAWALEHAVRHGKRRVVVVIPFTAIIEQTADVYRKAVGSHDAVLEHHASFDWEGAAETREDGGDDQDGLGRLRRAAENWDAPVVVTTAVQFFESLYANRTSRCRKLHNLADSVIVVDEAQTVPPRLLLPCLAALDELQRGYGASVVLCTATQPAWRRLDEALIERTPGGARVNLGLDIGKDRELAPDPETLYGKLRRVHVEVVGGTVDDAALAAAFAAARQMLCIVNSRAHARAVYERIKHMDGARQLTTLMCPAHRRAVLREVRARLKEGMPVRLVSTSLIEAGVDISFPEVWRAFTGLDSIAQAAGRCNREGELLPALGRVVVFTPQDAKAPRALRDFQRAAEPVLRDAVDPLGLDAVRSYFQQLYFDKGMKALDAPEVNGRPGILPAIREAEHLRVPFRSIAGAFRMIDEAMPPVLVPWDDRAADALHELEAGYGPAGPVLRTLQPYAIPVPNDARARLLGQGLLASVRRNLGSTVLKVRDMDCYSAATGLDLSDGSYRTSEENIW